MNGDVFEQIMKGTYSEPVSLEKDTDDEENDVEYDLNDFIDKD